MKKIFLVFCGILFLGLNSSYYLGCKKTDSPFGVYAPNGLDVPSPTSTPATGAFNCYVYDNGGKQGVTILLLDPSLSNPVTAETDQFGNAVFNPSPLVVGVYTAEVLAQGRYGLSALPITVLNTSQGPVSCVFTAASQALTIVSGAPASFLSGTGTFDMGISYVQPGTLDVPITVTKSILPGGWNISPSTFVLSMSNPSTIVAVDKVGCAVLNQPITWIGTDFLGNAFGPSAATTLIRNFQVNVQLALTETVGTCSCFGGTCKNAVGYVFTLQSPSDCGISWTLTVGSKVFTMKNGQTASWGTGTTSPCKGASSFTANLSSALGSTTGSGSSGAIINVNF